MTATLFRTFLAASAIATLSCATATPRAGSDFAQLYAQGRAQTLVNLHPDELRSQLYAVNYQQPGLILVCTDVEFVDWGGEEMKFRVVSSGREYAYEWHKAAIVPLEDHLAQYFGERCDQAAIDALSEIDQKGVRSGQPFVGMTKPGVVFALGYPPRHKNPTLEAPEWRYWVGRFATMIIVFGDDDTVSEIKR